MSGFKSAIGGDFDKYFMTTTDLIDRYATGGLWSWGEGQYGQLGIAVNEDRSSPVQTVSGGTNWKQVEVSRFHSSAIKTDGTLWLWGLNSNGQLGDNTSADRYFPVQTVSGGTNWKQVACELIHTAAIKTDGTLWLWGNNDYGNLGDNTTIRKSSPVQTIALGTNWKQVTCGSYHSAAIKTDGTLWLWGRNDVGQLGDNTRTDKSSPIQTVTGGTNWKQVACGYKHSAAIKTDGTLWLWGRNDVGQLGDNTRTDKSSPIQTVTGGTNWKQVSGVHLQTAAIKTDGTLWLWGRNDVGQLGDNTRTDKSSPIQTVSGGTNWKQVACGYKHSAAIKTDGTLWSCGYNLVGQLGDNTGTNKSSPVQTVSGGTNWKQVSCGNHTSAVQYSDIGQVL
jgi:alpha-tubulin suppressor-like RCC1 family protein